MRTIREHELFTRAEHVNTLAVSDNTALSLLHNSGAPSKIVQWDIETGSKQFEFENVGLAAHGLVIWDDYILTLDSRGGKLKLVRAQRPSIECTTNSANQR